jgi:hypothetical protein
MAALSRGRFGFPRSCRDHLSLFLILARLLTPFFLAPLLAMQISILIATHPSP